MCQNGPHNVQYIRRGQFVALIVLTLILVVKRMAIISMPYRKIVHRFLSNVS